MTLKLLLPFLPLLGAIGGAPPKVRLRGIAQDCAESQPVGIPGFHTFALDARKNRKMLAILRSMGREDWTNDNSGAMTRSLARYDSVMELLHRAHPIARATTDSRGRFTFTIAPADSVLVFGYDELEDQPMFYAFKVVGGRKDWSVILDPWVNCQRFP